MTYQYRCNKCNQPYEHIASIVEEKPKTFKCVCGGTLKYDWGQHTQATILIPRKFKA